MAKDAETSARKVPMEVLCFGMPRTGTKSMYTALQQLGYNKVYHMQTNFEQKDHGRVWVKAYNAKFKGIGKPFTKEDWDEFLGEYMAVTDVPPVNFWEELLSAYPEAKVVLTVRDADAWHKSVTDTIWGLIATKIYLPTNNPIRRLLRTQLPPFMQTIAMVFDATFGPDFPETGKQTMHDHNVAVQKAVSADRLLVMNVKEGWEPLCKFLGKPAPQTPFPRVNDSEEFRANARIGMIVADVVGSVRLLAMGGVLGGVMYGAFYAVQEYWRYRK